LIDDSNYDSAKIKLMKLSQLEEEDNYYEE